MMLRPSTVRSTSPFRRARAGSSVQCLPVSGSTTAAMLPMLDPKCVREVVARRVHLQPASSIGRSAGHEVDHQAVHHVGPVGKEHPRGAGAHLRVRLEVAHQRGRPAGPVLAPRPAIGCNPQQRTGARPGAVRRSSSGEDHRVKSCTCSGEQWLSRRYSASSIASFNPEPGWAEIKYGTRNCFNPFSRLSAA